MRILVPGTAEEGPIWEEFDALTHDDVNFTTSIGGGKLSEFKNNKLFVNPNAMIIMEFVGG